jgi:hypothetical protein
MLRKRIERFAVIGNMWLRLGPCPVKQQISPMVKDIQKLGECGVIPLVNPRVGMFCVMQWQGAIGAQQTEILDVQLWNRTQTPRHNGVFAFEILRGEIKVGALPQTHRVITQTQ